jgi:protein-disulfide isomerase
VVLKELMRLLRQRVRLVFRHFPLVTVHPVAQLAAEAAEQAAQADEFWGMHDLLFERQDFLDPQYLLTCAEELGLDVPAFAQSLESHVHLERVLRDFRSGARSGVNGTPTLFINGERYDGPIELGSLRAAIGLATHAVG